MAQYDPTSITYGIVRYKNFAELNTVKGPTSRLKFSLVHRAPGWNAAERKQVPFEYSYTVTFWCEEAAKIAVLIEDDQLVAIEGPVRKREYDDKEGVRKSVLEIDRPKFGYDYHAQNQQGSVTETDDFDDEFGDL